MKLVTAAQMRELEDAAVAAGTPLDELMEQAGLAVAQEAWMALGIVEGRRIVVLAGPGNNGGDGLVAARHLADWGADVVVYLLAPRPGDKNLGRVVERSVPTFAAMDDAGFASLRSALAGAEMIIDALIGIGRSRPIEGVLASVLELVSEALARPAPPKVLCVDLPTGIDADSGRADPLAIRADMTVTFGLAKVGLCTLPGSEYAGQVQVIDIGLPKDAIAAVALDLLDTAWTRDRLPSRAASSNKGTFGRVLVVAGSVEYPGAVRLAAEACYRTGAGLVTLASPRRGQSLIAPSIPEATWLPLPGDTDALSADAVAPIVEALSAERVLLIGPGLGQRAGVGDAVMGVLTTATARGCVIDADALNALSQRPGWHERVSLAAVLTPHPGEMARLLGITVREVRDDRLNTATKAAATWNKVVVLKGAHTVIAAPDGRAAISPHANPLLATAGTGDVLAGAIAGLLAQGLDPFEAAACGVYLHGLAAEEVGEELADRGMLANELLPALPRAIRTVMRGKRERGGAMPFAGMGDFGALAGLGGLGSGPGDAGA